jgi:hypothetical protein
MLLNGEPFMEISPTERCVKVCHHQNDAAQKSWLIITSG